MKKLTQTISTLTIAILAIVGVSYVQAAWSNPSTAPTGGNTDAPINVGGSEQSKVGTLKVGVDGSNIGAILVSTGASLRSLYVSGGAEFDSTAQFDGGIKIPTDAGAGKVLTSDASGNATWQTSGSSNVFTSQCVVASTNPNHREADFTNGSARRFWRVSLLNSSGKNVCEGSTYGSNLNSGCSYTIWRLKADGDITNMSQSMYGSTNYFLRQLTGNGNWTDDAGGQKGINGDNTYKYFVNWGDNFYVYDDYAEGTFVENSKNEWVIRADNTSYVWTISICPAM